MKKTIVMLVTALVTTLAFAQVPDKMSYQAVIRDASNNLSVNTGVGMQISILQATAIGTAVYVEQHFPTTNVNGLVSLEIGTGTVVSGAFAAINWANGPYFVKTETDLNGGANYTITGTSELLSVPYALHAKTADNVINDLVDDSDADPTNEIELPATANINEMLMWNGNSWIPADVCSLFSFFYADIDGDGFGDPFNTVFACGQPSGFITDNTDCNDADASINPNAIEICDGIDNNCDGQIDEGASMITQYVDNDGDGYGDYNDSGSQVCVLQSGYSLNNGDCYDLDATIHPNAPEICNDGIDNNCNGATDELACQCSVNSQCPTGYVCTGGVCVWVTVQSRLDNGETPCQIVATGTHIDSLYGKNYAGGLIFYLDVINCNGLVIAITEQSSGIQWYNGSFIVTGATSSVIGAGQANTIAIVSSQGVGSYAAQLCVDLVLNGYSDWFLPSIDAMTEIDNNLHQNGYGNFIGLHWSSTEDNNNKAWRYNFTGTGPYPVDKSITNPNVRAVRAF